MKRFWAQAEAVERDGGHAILLDGKPVNLPGEGALLISNARIAITVAAEWQGLGPSFGPEDLPLTRLASTAAARVPGRRAEIIATLVGYGMNDLLCYRAEAQPALAALEAAEWTPWADWAAARYGARLLTGDGITPVAQPPQTQAAFTAALQALPDEDLAGLGVIVPALGSLVLGLAVAAGALAPRAACALAELDALWQESRWGADAEAVARRAAIAEDVAVATRFMILCRP